MTVARIAPDQPDEVEVISQNIVKLAKQSGIYAVGDILPKMIPLVTIPILTRILSVEDFGVTDLVATMIALLSPFMMLGIDSGIQTYYFDGRDQDKKKRLISSGYWLLLIWCFLCCVILFPFSNYLARTFIGESIYIQLVELALLSIPFRLLIEITKFIMRVEERAWGYVFITLLSSFMVAGVSIAWLLRERSMYGYYMGMLISYVIVFLFSLPFIQKWLKFSISKVDVLKILMIGLPMLPAIFLSLCMNYLSRYFLLNYRSVEEVGYYQLGWKVATIVGFILPLINQAWMPMRFRLYYSNPNYQVVYRKMLDYLIAITTIGGLLITMFSSWLIGILAPSNYQIATITIAPFCIMTIAQSMNLVVYSGPALVKKPGFYWLTIVVVVVGIVFQSIFTPHFGIAGAAWATALTYCFMAIVYSVLMDPILHVCNFNWMYVASFVLISWASIYAMGLLNQLSPLSGALGKIGLLSFYGLALVLFGVVGKNEWGYLLQVIGKKQD